MWKFCPTVHSAINCADISSLESATEIARVAEITDLDDCYTCNLPTRPRVDPLQLAFWYAQYCRQRNLPIPPHVTKWAALFKRR